MKSTHSGQLERWVGADSIELLSRNMRGWYGPPILLGGVPGNIQVCGDGDFIGEIRAGYEASAADRLHDVVAGLNRAMRRMSRRSVFHTGGFSTLSDLLTEGRRKKQTLAFYRNSGASAAIGDTVSHWCMATGSGAPDQGAAASAAPGGTASTNTTAGCLQFVNPISGDKAFVAGGQIKSNAVGNVMIYDRLFSVGKTASSTTTEAVTGVPTRYQSTTTSDPDYAAGNFVFPEVRFALASSAHNWTVCKYTNQAGTASQTLPSATGNATTAAGSVDLTGKWFMPLADGDSGIKALTQMQCDTSISGTAEFVIGHPIMWMPCPIINWLFILDGVKSLFSLPRVFDGACLALLDVQKPATGGMAYLGSIDVVSG